MLPKFDFTGKVAIVTGAASGIGLAAATRFAEAGASVVMADFNEDVLKQRAEELSKKGLKVTPVRCDVCDEDSIRAMVAKAEETYGKLDYAYNNAGVQCEVEPVGKLATSSWLRVITTNLTGEFLCMKYEIQLMEKQGKGAIVNCSSLTGVVGIPGQSAYSASKHGILGLTKCAALEYADKGIRVNAICPGATDTPMVQKAMIDEPATMKASIEAIPMKRIATTDEMVSTVMWLCSDGAGFMTGQAITPDGGYSAR